MLKVISILGHSRSGTTLLDVLLGNHPDVMSTGELCNFYRYGHLEQQFCACHERVVDCPIWSDVTRRLVGRLGSDDFAAQKKLQDLFERYRFSPMHPLRNVFFQNRFDAYKQQLFALYESVAEASGKSIIVDSSKKPLRTRWIAQLARDGLVEAYYLFLVRDCRGVMWSYKKKIAKDPSKGVQMDFKGKNPWRIAAGWTAYNMECEALLSGLEPQQQPQALSLRYEDLCANPSETISTICGLIGVDKQPLLEMIESQRPLAISHTVSGSRHRMQKQLQFKPDLEWCEKLSSYDRWIFRCLAGWYARKRGYPLRAA